VLIKLKEYERIFQIVSAVVESEGGDPAKSCIYYSLFGATILIDHFRLQPQVRCGVAAFHLGEDDQVLCFGERIAEGIVGTTEGFHCWIEVNGWILDFMAPNFRSLKITEFTSVPRMFQKKVSEKASHPREMRQSGDFFFGHNQDLAEQLLLPICEHQGVRDLAHISSQWFKRPPKEIHPSISTGDQNGKLRRVKLNPVSLRSNWC
jgi:hypothetical protein